MPSSHPVSIQRLDGETSNRLLDAVAVEEPLEIRLALDTLMPGEHKPLSITMRTPGNDDELAVGFLFSEGLLTSPAQVHSVSHWGRSPPGKSERNVVVVELAPDVEIDLARLERHFYTTSSCGVCGKTSIDALRQERPFAAAGSRDFSIATDTLLSLPDALREHQASFGVTGGLHATGLFDRQGKLSLVREDVGRHNAMDKVVGRLFLDGKLPAADYGMIVSGRTSFELMQKAMMSGVSTLVAIGAPSSLAIEMAEEFGMTLAGFLRDSRCNVYANERRIT
ncbi:MAG: formate dehydrogenase accessory sulfurtransferase FdhD [Pseudomonadota bacterium]